MEYEESLFCDVSETELESIEGGHPALILIAGIWLGLEIGDRIWGMVRPGGSSGRDVRMERNFG